MFENILFGLGMFFLGLSFGLLVCISHDIKNIINTVDRLNDRLKNKIG